MIDTIDDLQALVTAFNNSRGWRNKHVPAQLAQAIAIEAAELLECFQWHPLEESTRLTMMDNEHRAAVTSEIADIAIYLLSLCDRTGIDLGGAIRSKLALNEQRFPASE